MDRFLRVSRWREQHLKLNSGIPEVRRQWSVIGFICSVSFSFGGNRLHNKILSNQRTGFLSAVTGLRIALLMSKGLSQSSLSGQLSLSDITWADRQRFPAPWKDPTCNRETKPVCLTEPLNPPEPDTGATLIFWVTCAIGGGLVTKSCPTPENSCSLPGSSIHRIL